MAKPYDSTEDTQAHIDRVDHYLTLVIEDLEDRADNHDASKMETPEVEVFDEFTPKLKASTYGSEEYKSFLVEMKVGLDHHYAVNDHHGEHFDLDLAWLPVKGYEGIYEISNYGDVKSLARKVERPDSPRGDMQLKERIISAHVTPKGYQRIQLSSAEQTKNVFVHRLVAEQFLERGDDKTQVNHKDGNKRNNHVSNLEWVTASENLQHAYDTELRVPPRLLEERRSRLAKMNLMQVTEMLCDWKAATERHDDGDIRKSIALNRDRFGYGQEFETLLLNTVEAMGW